MNLHDVVTLETLPAKPVQKDLTSAQTVLGWAKNMEAIRENSRWLEIDGDEYSASKQIEKAINKKLEQLQYQLLTKTGTLPEELRTNNSLSKVAVSPKTTMEAIRRLVDAFSMVAIPADYLNDRAINSETYQMQELISEFWRQLKPWFHIYVVTPITNYCVQDHIAKKEMPIYASPACAQAFMALQMSIPVFREIKAEQAEMRHEMNHRFKTLQSQIDSLSDKIQNLHQMMERQIAQTYEEKFQKEIEKAYSWIPNDPMMFAFPKELSIIKDNGLAIIGPCWGPDFDDILAEVGKHKKITGQRKLLSKSYLGSER